MKKLWPILIAIILGAIVGLSSSPSIALFGITFGQVVDLGGTLFLNSLSLVVIPLVVSAIISNLTQVTDSSSLRKLGIRTIFSFFITSSVAVILAATIYFFIQPGSTFNGNFEKTITLNHTPNFSNILHQIIPSNLIKAASEGNMLGLIFFSILFGTAASKINETLLEPIHRLAQASFQIMMRVTGFVLKAMPIGVFCLVAKTIASTGIHSITNLSLYFGTCVLALALFTFIILPLIALSCGRNPFNYIKQLSPAILTAFSTSSSAAAIPVVIDCMEHRIGIPKRILSFVIPLANSLNMAGTAIYVCLSVLFIAQVYGITLTITHYSLIALLSFLTSLGVAGIPSGCLVSILIILKTLEIPTESLVLIIPVDRILDMLRTVTNSLCGATSSLMVAGKEQKAWQDSKPTLN